MASEGETRPLLAAPQDPDNSPIPSSSHGLTATDAEVGGSSFSRTLGTAEAFAIVISIVIGSGIFTSPGSIDTNVPSPGAALVVWLIGGVLAWTGASTMAELGTAIPGEGTRSFIYSRPTRLDHAIDVINRWSAAVSEIHFWRCVRLLGSLDLDRRCDAGHPGHP